MKTYTAYFRTDAEFATREFKAMTPQKALAAARRYNDRDPLDLVFESYDGGMPVNEIAVHDPDDVEVAVWRNDDLRLRLAAQDLLDAAQMVIDRWEQGDLAEAVRTLDAAMAKARGVP